MKIRGILKYIDGYTHNPSSDEGKCFISKSITGSLAGRRSGRKLRTVFNPMHESEK